MEVCVMPPEKSYSIAFFLDFTMDRLLTKYILSVHLCSVCVVSGLLKSIDDRVQHRWTRKFTSLCCRLKSNQAFIAFVTCLMSTQWSYQKRCAHTFHVMNVNWGRSVYLVQSFHHRNILSCTMNILGLFCKTILGSAVSFFSFLFWV